MATYVSNFVEQINVTWKEVDILTSVATENNKTGNEELYNALCRSITVLMVAHFEGFVKDLVKAVISDLNMNSDFIDMPEVVKRTYCKKYFGNKPDDIKKNEPKIKLLKEKFEEQGCKISHEPFFFPVNKNPNNKTIKTVFSNFGIKEVFNLLYKSELENAAFTESSSDLAATLKKISKIIATGTKKFPYKCKIEEFKLTHSPYNKKTLWEEFIDEIINQRHDVAHGNNYLNATAITTLKSSKEKILLLEFALIGIICDYITKNTKCRISIKKTGKKK